MLRVSSLRARLHCEVAWPEVHRDRCPGSDSVNALPMLLVGRPGQSSHCEHVVPGGYIQTASRIQGSVGGGGGGAGGGIQKAMQSKQMRIRHWF